MKNIFNSVNAENEYFVDTPIVIDLQLFAEDEIQEADEIDTPESKEFDFDTAMKEAQEKPIEEHEELATPKPQKVEQSKEERAEFAAARREAEAKAKLIEDEREETAKDLGYESWKEFQDTVKAKKEADKKTEFTEKFGVDPEAVSEAFKATPEYKEFQQYKQDAAAKEQKAIAEKNINKAIADLNESFGLELKTSDDLNSIPNAIAIEALLKAKNPDGTNVYTIVDAYKMANGADIIQKKSAAIAQATLNKINSKSHLRSNDSAIELVDNTISNEELEIAKRFGFTEEQYRKNIYKK